MGFGCVMKRIRSSLNHERLRRELLRRSGRHPTADHRSDLRCSVGRRTGRSKDEVGAAVIISFGNNNRARLELFSLETRMDSLTQLRRY